MGVEQLQQQEAAEGINTQAMITEIAQNMQDYEDGLSEGNTTESATSKVETTKNNFARKLEQETILTNDVDTFVFKIPEGTSAENIIIKEIGGTRIFIDTTVTGNSSNAISDPLWDVLKPKFQPVAKTYDSASRSMTLDASKKDIIMLPNGLKDSNGKNQMEQLNHKKEFTIQVPESFITTRSGDSIIFRRATEAGNNVLTSAKK